MEAREQEILTEKLDSSLFCRIFDRLQTKKVFLVCGKSFQKLPVKEELEKCEKAYIVFSQFTSNPLYEEVCKGVEAFRTSGCDTILAVGGGSAMDVAKCIKIFSSCEQDRDYLEQEFRGNTIPLIAVPTTAGTGSESTCFSVIYREGRKLSVMDKSMLPEIAILDEELVLHLPQYQKRCTLMDAMCQAIESWWSVKSTEESISYARRALELIGKNDKEYLQKNDRNAAQKILLAANLAGRAINISRTTAPHAMSYMLTGLYGIPHGHAVALCLPKVWEYMLEHMDLTIDMRGKDYLKDRFEEIAEAMGAVSPQGAIDKFEEMLGELELKRPEIAGQEELEALVKAVNVQRLANNPVDLDEDAIRKIYRKVLEV